MYATYNFDDAGRLSNIVNASDSSTITYGYDNEDKVISRAYPNGVTTTYEYYNNDLLKRLKDFNSTATLYDRQYAYNTANQIETLTDNSGTRTFGYDLVDRLKTVSVGGTQTEFYNYDNVGNRTSSHLSATYGYQSGKFNQLASTATATMRYDPNGNMVGKSEGFNLWRYTWDYENRMVEASTRKQKVRYRYDALGRRVRRYTPGVREDTKFTNDGLDVIIDDDAGALTKYLNGPGIDNKLRVQNGSNVNYFLADHLGSTNGLADASGSLTSSTSYDSFGNQTSTLPTRYGYTGRERDDLTGQMYYRARFYDMRLGRFLSEDPIGFFGGDLNLYGYVLNNPVRFNDPTGLQRQDRDRPGDMYPGMREPYNPNRPNRTSPWDDLTAGHNQGYPECGPAGYPLRQWAVPDSVGGIFGPFGSKYDLIPPCTAHDKCYSSCGVPKAQCDQRLGNDITDLCLRSGGFGPACSFYGAAYYRGVDGFGGDAHRSAQEDFGCIACSLPLTPPPRDPCSTFGDWRCK